MVETQIARRGIPDRHVLQAMRRVPREVFLKAGFEEFAYEDTHQFHAVSKLERKECRHGGGIMNDKGPHCEPGHHSPPRLREPIDGKGKQNLLLFWRRKRHPSGRGLKC
jgi:hypothetical protein